MAARELAITRSQTANADARARAEAHHIPVPRSASSALKGNCFSSKAMSRSEIAKAAGSTTTSGGCLSRRRSHARNSSRSSPPLPLKPDQSAAFREPFEKRDWAKETTKTKNANILKACRRADPALYDMPQGTQKARWGGWLVFEADIDDRRRWWNKSGGRAIDVQAHHVATVEHSGADLRRGGRRRGLTAGVNVDRRGGSHKGDVGRSFSNRSGVRTLSGPLDVPPLKRETHCGTTGELHEGP
jgi:hypothetical protein